MERSEAKPPAAASDAFSPHKDMLTTDEAIMRLVSAVSPVEGVESVRLLDSYGRVLAHDLVARRTVPAADNSAVDGYAVRTADLTGPETKLPVSGRIAAGHRLDRAVQSGEALRIFTGAPVPDGIDAIIPQENTRSEADGVILPKIQPGANIRKAGEDFHKGSVVLKAGKRLLPQDAGHAAAAGYAELTVRRRPCVLLFATGDEVCEPGQDKGPESTVNSNMYTLFGMVRRLGCDARYLGILPDDPARLKVALADAAASGGDLIMTTGGVSVGEEDHVKAAVEALGSLHFWRIAIRPGRPLAFGQIGSIPFVGLPGNPVAATVTFLIFARPLLLALCGALPHIPRRFFVPAAFAFNKKTGRREWLRGSLVAGSDGTLMAENFANGGSGIFSSVVMSEGLIELTEDQASVAPGDLVPFIPFTELLS